MRGSRAICVSIAHKIMRSECRDLEMAKSNRVDMMTCFRSASASLVNLTSFTGASALLGLGRRAMMLRSFFAALSVVAISAGTETRAESLPEWEFRITPYVWMSGLDGKVGAFPGTPPADVNLKFSDIVDDLDFASMVMASARKGPLVLFLDSTFVSTSTNAPLGGAIFNSAGIKSKTATLAFAAGGTISETSKGSVEAYAGARAWWLENEFTLRPVAGGAVARKEKASWIDPLIGITGRYRASDRWSLFGTLEVGGFGVGADIEWSVMAGATYNVSERFGLSFGWRHLAVDYSEAGILFDIQQSGPVLGATFQF